MVRVITTAYVEKEGENLREICSRVADKVEKYLKDIVGNKQDVVLDYRTWGCMITYRIEGLDKWEFGYAGKGEIVLNFDDNVFRTDFGMLTRSPKKEKGYTITFRDTPYYRLSEIHIHGTGGKSVHIHFEGELKNVEKVLSEILTIVSVNKDVARDWGVML